MTTFYIAASSEEIPRVQNLARILEDAHGWTWHDGWDWTTAFDDPDGESAQVAYKDLTSSRHAHNFIYLQSKGDRSIGANREYGMRLGTGQLIFRVSDQPKHLFDLLTSVITFKTVTDLLNFFKDAT